MIGDLYSKLINKLRSNFVLFILLTVVISIALGVFLSKKYNFDSTSISFKKDVSADENDEIFIDLSGAVNKPGVYKMANGSRLSDLVEKGGGVSDGASLEWVSKNINFSSLLEDSQKIYIPFEGETYSPDSKNVAYLKAPKIENSESEESDENEDTAEDNDNDEEDSESNEDETEDEEDTNDTDDGKVNVNKASLSDLDALPGIGPVYAQKIIDNRSYSDFDDFRANSGLKASTIDGLKDLISF